MVHNIKDGSQCMTDKPLLLADGQHCMADGLFGDLDGIDEARDVRGREKTTLEKLLELASQTVSFFSSNFSNKFKRTGDPPIRRDFMLIYSYTHSLLDSCWFDETDISSFVKCFDDIDYNKLESKILGIFTSCLAYALTERNREKGKRTKIYLNGNGAKFDYLFCCLPDFDELVIENFNGDYIGASNGIGSLYLSLDIPLEKDITEVCGDSEQYFKILSTLRKEKKTEKRIVGINLKGIGIFEYPSCIDQIVLINVEGENTCASCSVGMNDAFVNQLIAVNINGHYVLSALCSTGLVNHVVAVNIEGFEAFSRICSDYIINKIVADNIRGENAFSRYGLKTPVSINQMIFNNSMGLASELKHQYNENGLTTERLQSDNYFQGGCKELICIEEATSEQLKVIKRERIEDILRLAHSLPGKPYQEVLEIADELYALRPRVPEGFFGEKIKRYKKR
ncbi:hypothetical protein HY636_05760 [Candidatus Woesearchaeota archaeon]|nr:hypothetical protein [Candidatus Woesearchaeota archaeon]